ncbi:MAG: hypothetical protein ABFD54_04440 [Armatimonadota bacterium]
MGKVAVARKHFVRLISKIPKFSILVCEHERLPNYYGLAWYEHKTRKARCYIIPFNYVVRWIRDFRVSLWFPRKSTAYDQLLRDNYKKGYEDGLETGRKNAETAVGWLVTYGFVLYVAQQLESTERMITRAYGDEE